MLRRDRRGGSNCTTLPISDRLPGQVLGDATTLANDRSSRLSEEAALVPGLGGHLL